VLSPNEPRGLVATLRIPARPAQPSTTRDA
jgi:hypothetical protein